eukprot:ANDGO_02419.mRNA.1 Small nuclear ribonucleoprotein G
MTKLAPPDLKKYLEKKVSVKMNANRTVVGILRGFDQFMNITMEDVIELVHDDGAPVPLGTVLIRGNSVHMLELLERSE